MSLNEYVPEQFVPLFSNVDFQNAQKGFFLYLIKEDKQFQAEVKALVLEDVRPAIEQEIKESYKSSEFITNLEYGILKTDTFCEFPTRLKNVEYETGLAIHDYEHKTTIHERIVDIESKINSGEFRPTISPTAYKIHDTATEHRAVCLVDALKDSKKGFFTAPEILEFLKCKLPDDYKVEATVKNIRKVKQDVVKKAVEMFSSIVEANQKTTGHRDIRLILKS